MKSQLKKLLPSNITANVVYTGKKLASSFNIKDRTKFEHKHDVVYLGICPNQEWDDKYIGGKAKHRIEERMKDHKGRDKCSHLFKHTFETKHQHYRLYCLRVWLQRELYEKESS